MRFQPLVSHAPGYDPEHVAALGEAQHEPRAKALGRRPEVLEDEPGHGLHPALREASGPDAEVVEPAALQRLVPRRLAREEVADERVEEEVLPRGPAQLH